MAIYATTGSAVKALSIDDVLGPGMDSGSMDYRPRDVYRLVPFVRRAVELRASAVASVPMVIERGGKDVTNRPEWRGLIDNLVNILWRTEAALCLSLHGATWRKATNKAGLNPTPEWLLPHMVRPRVTAEGGVIGVTYTRPWGVAGAGMIEELPLDAVVRFWLPNFDRVDEPGPPPGLTALNAARVLANKDSFIAAYFGRGAVKSVLLQVPPDSKPADRDRLTSWWRGITSGVRNAWRSVVIQSSITPVIIGDGLKEMNNESLTREYRQEVAAAFGIPETMLLQAAANFATAKTDRISFYEETVFPEVWRLVEAINTQWLMPAYGAELIPQPDLTEERQGAQLQQAEAITALVGQPVMTLNEGRAWLGLDPLPEGNEVAPDEATVTKALRDERTTLRLRHAVERHEAPSAAARLRLVRRQAEEREALSVKHTLLSDSPAIKAAKLTPEEKKLAKELEPILQRYGAEAVNAVLGGTSMDTSKLSDDLRRVILEDITAAAMRSMTLSAEEVGMAMDAAAASTRASEWARANTFSIVRGLDATTRAGLQSSLAAFLETPGMDRATVTNLLAPLFGRQRAEVIAVTETTRAAAEGVKLTQQELRAAGLSFERIWRTSADERTCPVCSALNGKPEREWGGVEPPAHPWCRCATTLRYAPAQAQPTGATVTGANEPPRETLDRIEAREDQLRLLRGREEAYAVDAQGDVIFERVGGDYYVDIPASAIYKMKRNGAVVLTHNHPSGWEFPPNDPRHSGNSFSAQDIQMACRANLAQMRAVTPTHTYTVTRPDRGWDENYWQNEVDPRRRRVEAEVLGRFQKAIDEGKMTAAEAEHMHYHTVWTQVFRELGITYRKEAR